MIIRESIKLGDWKMGKRAVRVTRGMICVRGTLTCKSSLNTVCMSLKAHYSLAHACYFIADKTIITHCRCLHTVH